MLKSILFILLLASSTPAFCQYGWINTFGDVYTDLAYGATIDDDQHLIVAGSFYGTVDFNPTQSGYTVTSTDQNPYLIKYDSNGEVIWLKTFECEQHSYLYSVCTDGTNIYVYGASSGQIDLDPGVGQQLTTTATPTLFFCKLDSDGNFIWGKHYEESAAFSPRFISYLGNDKILLTGLYSDSFDADPGSGTTTLSTSLDNGFFYLTFNTEGDFIWARQLEHNGFTFFDMNGITSDENGNIYSTGFFGQNIDFNPGAGNTNTVNSGNLDFYLLKFDANGDFSYVITQPSGTGQDIKIDNDNNLVISGTFSDVFDFDFGTGNQSRTPQDSKDGFILKTELDGSFNWVKTLNGNGDQVPKRLNIMNNNQIRCAGRFVNELTIYDGIYNYSNISTTQNELFYIRMDEHGAFDNTLTIEGPGVTSVFTTCSSEQGEEYIVGHFSGTEDLYTETEERFYASAGGSNFDAYVMNLGELNFASVSENDLGHNLAFPNPTKDKLCISNSSNEDYRIFDMTGREVASGRMIGNEINVQYLENGSYLLQVDSFKTIQFIKN